MKKLYKILIVGLFIVGIFISFCSAEKVSDLIEYLVHSGTFVKEDGSSYPPKIYEFTSSQYGDYCFQYLSIDKNYGGGSVPYYVVPSNTANLSSATIGSSTHYDKHVFRSDQYGAIVCFPVNTRYLYVSNGRVSGTYNTVGFSGYYNLFRLDTLLDENIYTSQFTSQQCQLEYNLIPVSSVDQNYCVNNGLCPICPECPSGTGDYTGDLQYSNIYINNILHPGRQNIFINIPDYIVWDYSQNEVDFNVYVGSGYDVDYINSIVDINSYRPTSEDFTNVFVSGLTLVFPYIFVALLILFIWKLLKRIFK